MQVKVTKKVDRLADLAKALKALTTERVLVGVPAAEAQREDEPINNATLAYIHNSGAPEANIPARPFMEPGIEAAQEQITNQLRGAAEAALDGRSHDVSRRLNAAGLVAASSVQEQINDGDFAPLKAATIAARLRRGRTGDKPLVDTGKMRDAITYVLRSK